MNEASYRAMFEDVSDAVLEEDRTRNLNHAKFGEKMLSERAEAKRKAEEAARLRPGDIVRYKYGNREEYLVASSALRGIVIAHYGFSPAWITTINLADGTSSSDDPSAFEKVR